MGTASLAAALGGTGIKTGAELRPGIADIRGGDGGVMNDEDEFGGAEGVAEDGPPLGCGELLAFGPAYQRIDTTFPAMTCP